MINAPFDADRASPQSPSHVGGGIIVSLVAFCLEMTNNNNPDSRKKKNPFRRNDRTVNLASQIRVGGK